MRKAKIRHKIVHILRTAVGIMFILIHLMVIILMFKLCVDFFFDMDEEKFLTIVVLLPFYLLSSHVLLKISKNNTVKSC